jgi:hypothetical protein
MKASESIRLVKSLTRTGILGLLFIAGCAKDRGNNPPLSYAVIQGKVMKATDSSGIASANVTAYNANTNSPVTRTLSDAQGNYRLEVAGGTYYLKVAAQGFFPSPPLDGAPLPFVAVVNDTVIQNKFLFLDPGASSTGSISGTVASGTSGVSGVLIVAVRSADSLAISDVSGPEGFFVLYNMPAGSYSIKCYLAGYVQVSDTSILVSPNIGLTGVNLLISSAVNGHLAGKITFLASQNSQVDITLVHPITRDAIPGLNTINDGNNNYSLTGIPSGTYIAWASYRNDGYVMDPDWIRKNGLPLVTFSGIDTLLMLNFSVTDAITIDSPTNTADSVFAVPIATTTPTFTWEAYPSAKEYIIEVSDSHGNVIWGGFDSNGVVRHAQIDQHQTSAVFNFDGSAVDSLKNGESYHWKIYADDDAALNIQGLISDSEDLRGLFKVVLQ